MCLCIHVMYTFFIDINISICFQFVRFLFESIDICLE